MRVWLSGRVFFWRWIVALLVLMGGLAAPFAAVPRALANSTVCNLFCDARDPAAAVGDRQAAGVTVYGRSIGLHVSDGDDMAWAVIGSGSAGDEVWTDRSFDGGQSWTGGSKLGDTTVPSGAGGWRTLMFNIDDPQNAGVGVVRACGKAGDRADIVCTSWQRGTHAVVCHTYCDARDPALAAGDREVARVSTFGRSVVIHVSDGDDMAWAVIGSGSPGDEVWMDRSFDGGQTWSDGSKLGDTTVPSGAGGWRTAMYNVDDPAKFGVGAVRACGRAAGESVIVCTAWVRSVVHAGSPAAAGATALVQYFNPVTGLWSGFGSSSGAVAGWQDANALTAMIDYMQGSGDATYAYLIPVLYRDNLSSADFTDGYIDDAGWWSLAWLRAYQYTGNSAYLQTAEYDADYMSQYWDGTCGGGVWWSTARQNKNAIANELYLYVNAALHNTLPGDTTYLARAQEEWIWFAHSGLINSSGLVNDGLNLSNCQNDGAPTYTYIQGVIVAGLGQLYRATGDYSLVTAAGKIATAATSRLTVGGILVDPCEPNNCATDGYTFKGVFVRDLRQFERDTGVSGYDAFLGGQAASIGAHDTDADGQSGLFWAGPISAVNFADGQSALDALDAATG